MRNTESRLPAGMQAGDLGEAVAAGDGRCVLVSYLTAPIPTERNSTYVLFVTDAGLAGQAQSFEWTFTENADPPTVQTVDHGVAIYEPQSTGSLVVGVRVLDAANAEQATLTLTQEVIGLNIELESEIEDAEDQIGPVVTNPDVAREMVNDLNAYHNGVSLKTPEAGDAFHQFVFSTVFDGALRREPAKRDEHVEGLAGALNGVTQDFAIQAADGVGVSGLRPLIAAMTFGSPSPLLDWTELPEASDQRRAADQTLRETLAALDNTALIDLFNVLRFPKSNVTLCARTIEALRDRYFPGATFDSVLTGMSGTRAHWIIRHLTEGPLKTS